MLIIGAGLAGLLAGKRLYSYKPIIMEAQDKLPNNHSALLRFRSDAVAQAIGLTFKKVRVYKGILNQVGDIVNEVTLKDINAYSTKVVSMAMARSITSLDTVDRWIAPNDLVNRLSIGTNIEFNSVMRNKSRTKPDLPIISTIPMPVLAGLLEYPEELGCTYSKVYTINCYLANVDLYQTLYLPYYQSNCYRASITGNKLTLECNEEVPDEFEVVYQILQMLGIISTAYNVEGKWQDYGKIIPIDERKRQAFILWATDNFNVYSLGRFATWRNILLDDVLNDIYVIEQMITMRNKYKRHLHYAQAT